MIKEEVPDQVKPVVAQAQTPLPQQTPGKMLVLDNVDGIETYAKKFPKDNQDSVAKLLNKIYLVDPTFVIDKKKMSNKDQIIIEKVDPLRVINSVVNSEFDPLADSFRNYLKSLKIRMKEYAPKYVTRKRTVPTGKGLFKKRKVIMKWAKL